MNLKRIRKCVISGAAALGVITAGFAAGRAYAVADEKQNSKILDNIYIGEIAVGGMNAEEANQAVTDYVDGLKETAFTLTVNGKSITANAGQLGMEWENTGVVEEAVMIGKSGSLITRYKDKKDLEHEPKTLGLTFGADESKIKNYLKENEDKVNQEAVDGGLVRENGAFTITGGDEGIAVNVSESAKTIAEYITNDWDTKDASIELTADFIQPRGSKEELAKVKDVLASFSTDYSSSKAGRAMNVSNGCSKINGTVLYPGDEFSVYEAVNPFTAENGYALAGSYENGTVVETYGGGICQVSTTLYNAVIRAELEVKERWAHSMIVTYVQPSMDAAIAGTYKDFKFANNTSAPVYIEGITEGGIITFNIYGEETRAAGREVIFESEVVSETPAPTNVQASSSYNVGYISVQSSTHDGKTARLWKVVKVNGVEQSREEFNNSTYRASPKTIIVGTGTDNDEAREIIQNAIATKDEAAIRAAAARAEEIAAQPQEPEEEEETQEETKPKDKPKKDNKKDKTDKDDTKKDDKKDKTDKDDTKNDDASSNDDHAEDDE